MGLKVWWYKQERMGGGYLGEGGGQKSAIT